MSSDQPGDMPAFPVTEFDLHGGHVDGRYEVYRQHFGVTLRQWFAGQAIVGIFAMEANPRFGTITEPFSVSAGHTAYMAKLACDVADAMLAELEKPRQ